MATPGASISANDVYNEFPQVGRPIKWSSFRGLGGAPTGATISLGDMRNRSNNVALRISGGAYSGQLVTSGASYGAADTSLTVTADIATSFIVTRTSGFGSPATGSYNVLSQAFSVASVRNDRTATWTVSAGGKTFNLSISATGTGTGIE